MMACNSFGESVIHQACRRSSFDVVAFMISQSGAPQMAASLVDDCGRTPLHDACWRQTPNFGIITLLMDFNRSLILTGDVRGASPLAYCREEHWLDWCAYLFHQKDRYWPPLQHSAAARAVHVNSAVPASIPAESSSFSSGTISSCCSNSSSSSCASISSSGSGCGLGSTAASSDGAMQLPAPEKADNISPALNFPSHSSTEVYVHSKAPDIYMCILNLYRSINFCWF